MEFAEVVRGRRMVRNYQQDREVPDAVLDRLLQAATRAPSAGFSQGWDFVVCRRPADVDRFWAAATPPAAGVVPDPWLVGMRTAPVLVVCLSDRDRYLRRYAEPDKGAPAGGPPADRGAGREAGADPWPVPYWDVDTGMAALLLLLGAVDAGLGACFFGVPAERHAAVLEALRAPQGRRVVGVVSLGHAAPDRRSPSLRRGRRPVDEVAHDATFGRPWHLRARG